MLPNGTQTYLGLMTGSTTTTAINMPCTILGYQILQDKLDSKMTLYDGSQIISYSYAVNTPYIPIWHICQNNLTIKKEGVYNAFITINYLPYSTGSTTADIVFGLTSGETLIAFFLFLIILGSVFSFIIRSFINNKIK